MIQLTNASIAPNGCEPVGYSYWSNINNHRSDPFLAAFIGRIGQKPVLLRMDKTSGRVDVLGELPFSGTGEGWYFSDTLPHALYVPMGPSLLRYDILTGRVETVFTLDERLGASIWQAHSSADDQVHSATVRDASGRDLGCVVVDAVWGQRFYPIFQAYDECQIDRSGRWLVIKQGQGDNRIVDLQTTAQHIITDAEGAVGHSDCGDGILVGEDDQRARWALVSWNLRDLSKPAVVHYEQPTAEWGEGLGHVSVRGSYALVSNMRELVLVPLDGSHNVRVIGPTLIDPDRVAADPYRHRPKANLDPTGEFCCWTSNHGSDRLDLFIERIGVPIASPAPSPSPQPAPRKESMNEFYVFTMPPDATVELHHDAGRVFLPTVGTKDGRPAHKFEIDGIPDGWGAQLIVTREGFVPVEQRGILVISRGLLAEFLVDDVQLQETRRPFEPLARLRPRGQFLELETGEPWTAVGTSDFQLLERFIAGEDLTPILRQRRDLGFNLLRVFATCDFLFKLDPSAISDYDDQLRAFLTLVESEGLRVELVALVDMGRLQWSLTSQHLHVDLVADALAGTPHLFELVNENDQTNNRTDVDSFLQPMGLVSSHGSNGSQKEPVKPFWTYATFHTNGASEEQRKIGHNAWELWNGPSVTNETSRYPQVGMWAGQALDRQKNLAYDSAAGAALLCAGATFHSFEGRGSVVFTGDTIDVARAWVDGARSVPLEFQQGRYNRADELRGPDDLRVYQRILPDGRAWTVHIRE